MKKKQHYCIALIGVLLSVITLLFGLQNKTHPGFSLEKIRSPFEVSSKWAVEHPTNKEQKEIRNILNQDFNYLGSGSQCYAFLSADGKYVLKFFKIKHLVPKLWLRFIPLPGLEKYRFNKIDKRISRHSQLFSSYKIAYQHLREETGLTFVHLNKSKNLNIRMKLYDRLRNCYIANLDDYEFIIQEKAQLVRDKITYLMQKGKREEAVIALHSLLNHIVKQCEKGFIDKDSGVSHNYGFVGDRIIHFDVGRILQDASAKDPSYYQHEVLRVGKKLEEWIRLEFPMLLEDMEEVIHSIITLSGEKTHLSHEQS